MSRDTQAAANAAVERKPLVSHSSILIFSGVLIGMVAARMVSREWQPIVYLVGLFGLVAYFGLALLAERRQRRTAERALEKASADLEHRFDRHVHREPVSAKLIQGVNSSDIERQYLTVADSNRSRFRR